MTTLTSPETSFEPMAPLFHHEPLRIAEDTYIIRQIFGEGMAPVGIYGNSMVILGEEPVLVDTGTVANRRDWLNDTFSLVDPKDVRWVFLSHDDADHVGNLREVMALCENAVLVSNWFQIERLSQDMAIPPHRMRWIHDGESFLAGDRKLVAIRPPIYDSPATRGLYDGKSGVYWAADAFCTTVMNPVDDVCEMDREFWKEAFPMIQSLLAPWHAVADYGLFNQQVDRIAELNPRVIVSGHTPPITAREVDQAITMMREMPNYPAAVMPGQEVLDQVIQAMGVHA